MPLLLQLLDPAFDYNSMNKSPDQMNVLDLATAVIWQLSFDPEVRKLLAPSGSVLNFELLLRYDLRRVLLMSLNT